MQLRIVPESLDSENHSSFMGSDDVMDTKRDTRRLETPWRGWS